MKRDMDLIRKILFEIEKSAYTGSYIDVDIEGYKRNEVDYHVSLLYEAKLIRGNHNPSREKPSGVDILSLTWDGHEFLDAARDEGIWAKSKQRIKDEGIGLTFSLLKELLIHLARERIFGAPQP